MMATRNNAPLSSEEPEEQEALIPEFNQTLTCTAFLFNETEEHLQLPEDVVKRFMAGGEDFIIQLKPLYDIHRQAPMSKYHFLRASAIYRLYVHEEIKDNE